MIVGCDAAENYMLLDITSGASLNKLLPDKEMRLKILKRKCACGSSFVKIIWKPLSLKVSTTLRIRSELGHQAMFLQKFSENKGMQKPRRICCSDSLHFKHFSACSISLVASIMLSIYAKLSSHGLAI